jgi:hypothetical protein
MSEEKSGMLMWREWRTTVSQRLALIIIHSEWQPREAEEKMEGKSQCSSLASKSGRTGVSLKRRSRIRIRSKGILICMSI